MREKERKERKKKKGLIIQVRKNRGDSGNGNTVKRG